MTPTDLEVLQSRLAYLENLERGRALARQQVKRAAVMISVLGAFAGGVAWAANGNCPNGLPFCFTEDAPAVASQVNHNFSQVKEWLEQKVGTAGTPNITTTGTLSSASLSTGTVSSTSLSTGMVSASSVTTTGAVSAASVTTGSLSASGAMTVSGTLTSGTHVVNGDLSVGSNTWGTGPTPPRLTAFRRQTCNVESGARCAQGQYVCGLFANHACGQDWFDLAWTVECCSL